MNREDAPLMSAAKSAFDTAENLMIRAAETVDMREYLNCLAGAIERAETGIYLARSVIDHARKQLATSGATIKVTTE